MNDSPPFSPGRPVARDLHWPGVSRDELLSRLREGQGGRLTLVIGGPGFGKTSLLMQWMQRLRGEGAHVAWLALSADDESLGSMGEHLARTLQAAGLADEALAPLAEAEIDLDEQAMASLVIGAIDQTDGPWHLLVDDVHVTKDPRIHRLLQLLINNAPPQLHIVLSSRSMPDLMLGRWRARGEVTEIDGHDLSFRFNETLAFLQTYVDPCIDLDRAHVLHEQADGWPIGLQLLSLAAKVDARRSAGLAALQLNRRGLGTYLAEDVLADLPDDLVDFLQQICFLRRFNAAAANHVTRSDDGDAHIKALVARNLFLQEVDAPDETRWFRLHRMFAEFLSQRSRQSIAERQALYRRASCWFEADGHIAEAVHYALLTDEFDFIVDLLKRVRPPYNSISHLRQFTEWLARLPTERLAAHPDLLLLGVWCSVLRLQPAPATPWLAVIERTPQAEQWAGQIALIKASLAIQRDDVLECRHWLDSIGERALESPFLEEVRACLDLSCLGAMGRYPELRHKAESSALRAMRDSSHEMALLVAVVPAVAAQLEARPLDVLRLCGDVLQRAEQIHGRRSVSACSCAALMAPALYELNRLDDAREVLANRLDVLRVAAPEFTILASLAHARLQNAQTSARLALDYLDSKAETFRQSGLARGEATMLAEQVRILLASGDIRQAERTQARLGDLRDSDREPGPRQADIAMLAGLSMTRIALARGQLELGLRLLSDLDGPIDEYGRGACRVQSDLLRSLLLAKLERMLESQEYLTAAVMRGYRSGLVRTFLDEGEPLQTLLKRCKRFGDRGVDDYVANLLLDPAARNGSAASHGIGGVTLTRREWDIVELLVQSMSNKRIALALDISLETVKWNLKNIFVKLGVSNRYDAIVLARQHLDRLGPAHT